jgi:hypothetical protein
VGALTISTNRRRNASRFTNKNTAFCDQNAVIRSLDKETQRIGIELCRQVKLKVRNRCVFEGADCALRGRVQINPPREHWIFGGSPSLARRVGVGAKIGPILIAYAGAKKRGL